MPQALTQSQRDAKRANREDRSGLQCLIRFTKDEMKRLDALKSFPSETRQSVLRRLLAAAPKKGR